MKDRTLLTGKRKPGGVGGSEGLTETVAELIKRDCMVACLSSTELLTCYAHFFQL